MVYLDSNLSSNGLDDPALRIKEFYLPWWTSHQPPTSNSLYLCLATINSALNHYRQLLQKAAFIAPHSIRSLADELNKPVYTWHSSVNDGPNFVTYITWFMVVRLPMRLRRTSPFDELLVFNKLFKAALKKESNEGQLEAGSGSGSGVHTHASRSLDRKGWERKTMVWTMRSRSLNN